jgi:GT2 family glycosyltransferase
MTKNKPIISFIIVNYKSEKYLQQCLRSIEKFVLPILKKDFETIIVNNDLNPLQLVENLITDLPIQIIENKKNYGFGQAVNQAEKNAQGKFLFLLNPDSFFQDNSFKSLLDYLKEDKDKNKDIILGIKILDAESKKEQKWSYGQKISLSKVLFRKKFKSKKTTKSITKTDWVSGAGMIINKKLFQKLDGFDKKFFMYFEDQDLCLRAQNKKASILFFPLTQIYHWGGKSWNKKTTQKTEYYKSQDYFFQKHFPAWQGQILKIIRNILKK